ncbi:acyltransferase family protein [Escherichia coli]|uniref:acyltransferase family protein n=1 Tax=Escherichia coli TaxID=562 RepID=UPI001FF424B5|nr:acyltransferase family protein [Escherichia coli]MDD8206657.1 acyltransferase family protein [Escherichia coli]MDD8240050.1 acyltransferase family protein [Escherichia coli]MDD9046146.1 acyltransferase family protein [Escherichia coli]HCN8108196.1 acyltransferase family protein [Escherichia coli]HDP6498566.1 acyltransferase family protein [Escherichia coli]
MKVDNSVNKLGYIDATRGIAILMVIMVHTSQLVDGLPGLVGSVASFGQMGVQLFFVASALTLCMSHSRRSGESNPTIKYFIRRFFRIAPLYYCGIIGFFVLNYVGTKYLGAPYMHEGQYSAINILSNIFMLHGLIPSANNTIVPGGWSIGTEFIFYALFPLLFIFFDKIHKKAGLKAIFLAWLVITALNFAFQFFYSSHSELGFFNNSFWYFNISNNLSVFIAGFMIFYGADKIVSSKPVAYLIFAVLIALSIFIFSLNENIIYSIVPAISGIAFIFLISGLERSNASPRIIRRIGQLSFAMYITHIVFTSYVMRAVNKHIPDFSPSIKLIIFYIIVVSLSFVAAIVCEKLIENPGIQMGKKLINSLNHGNDKSKYKVVIALGVVLLLCASSAVAYRHFQSYMSTKRVADFQSVMLDFKKMNANQADGDYIIYGDSLIQGMSPYGLNFKYVNMGVGGYSISQILSLSKDYGASGYKGAIIEGGVNDAMGSKTQEEISRDYEKLIGNASMADNVYALKILPIISGARQDVDHVNSRISMINSIIDKLCTGKFNCKVIEVPAEFLSDKKNDLYFDDGVHLNKNGYAVWMREINKHVK